MSKYEEKAGGAEKTHAYIFVADEEDEEHIPALTQAASGAHRS